MNLAPRTADRLADRVRLTCIHTAGQVQFVGLVGVKRQDGDFILVALDGGVVGQVEVSGGDGTGM